jgi:hypothetical protein
MPAKAAWLHTKLADAQLYYALKGVCLFCSLMLVTEHLLSWSM